MNKQIIFDDLHEFWIYAFQESNAHQKSSRDNISEWNGGVSWIEAKQLAINGWEEGLKEIKKYHSLIIPKITNKILISNKIHSVAGYNVDVGRYLSNDPECFVSREIRVNNSPGKVFTLVCSISFSSNIQPKIIIQRGAIICALIDAIEYAGHRVEVIFNASMSYRNSSEHLEGKLKNNGWLEISTTVKKADQHLTMIELAFCLAHPAMLRRIVFSVAELEGWSDFSRNYGYPAQATEKGDLYIQEIFSGEVSNNKAIDWIITELKKLEIEITENN